MTDLVERHKPREGRPSLIRPARKAGVPVTTPVRQEREGSPPRTERIDHALVDQRVE
jgi:hypothetical protein